MSGKLLDTYPAGSTIYAIFDTFGADGESLTLTGLAVTDIEIFKNGSVTQRSSDAGYALLDTDGIDFDSRTGIHGISIDLSDNTDAGFYAAGSQYTVVIDAVTINTQTVRFVLGAFRIVAAETTAGTPNVHAASLADGSLTAAKIGADAFTAAKFASDVTTEFQSGLATAAALDAVDNFVDTEVAAIKTVVDAIQAKTDNLPSDPADASVVAGLIAAAEAKIDTVDTVVDAIKAKTDSLTYTVAGVLDANIQRINDVAITGDGQVGTEFTV
jgi:hypothetical protein